MLGKRKGKAACLCDHRRQNARVGCHNLTVQVALIAVNGEMNSFVIAALYFLISRQGKGAISSLV